MRKDNHPRYLIEEQGRSITKTKREVINARAHNCIICRSTDREEIERKYLEGWRLCDIMRVHPWIRSDNNLRLHFDITGLADKAKDLREIDSREILERIVRAGLPVLEEGKVYPRDVIDAIKALNELQSKQKTDTIWNIINVTKEKDESPGNFKSTREETGLQDPS